MDQDNRTMRATMGSDAWPEVSEEFRRQFKHGHPADRTGAEEGWEMHEPWYRYGHEMAGSDAYRGRTWEEVEGDLRTNYPTWAEGRGYKYTHRDKEHDTAWERFKANVREAWDKVTGKTSVR